MVLKPVSLCLLFFAILLLMNGNGSSARDMKVQQEHAEGKQVNQAYLDGWLKAPEATEKVSHGSNQVYLDGWLKDTQEGKEKSTHNLNQVYLDGWLKDTQDKRAKVTHNSNQAVYLDGWLKDTPNTHSSKQVYLDGWLKDSHDMKEKNTPSKQVYLDGWLKDSNDMKEKNTPSNQVYLDGWLKDIKEKKEKASHNMNQAYLDGWLKDTPNTPSSSNQVYLDGWLKDIKEKKEKASHNMNQAYLDGWLKDTPNTPSSSKQVYLDGWLKDIQEKKKEASHNMNQAYLDGWLKDTPNTPGSSNQVYLDGWLKDSQDTDDKTTHLDQIYLDGWLKDSKDGRGKATHNSNQVYLDGWLKDSHVTNHKKTDDQDELAKSKEKYSSPKVDHREAFKLAFFTLEDLYVGNVMTLQFPIREYANFLPRKHADSIPFSKSQLPSLLQLFSLTEDSPQGEDMKDIIDQCEFEPQKGETKACPTSLESMIEFVQSVLGVEAKYNIHSTSYPTTSGARLQNYTILKISEDIYAPKWVACHPRPYPYALYYCHYLDIGSKVFKVLLRGEYGDVMDALGICHLDTSDMNPNHALFHLLGMKPGDAPLCHFFPVKHLLWVPLPAEVAM